MKVVIDGTDVEVKIIRKSNKNTYIRVKSDLCIYVTTNYFVSDKYVSNLINNNIDGYASITYLSNNYKLALILDN